MIRLLATLVEVAAGAAVFVLVLVAMGLILDCCCDVAPIEWARLVP